MEDIAILVSATSAVITAIATVVLGFATWVLARETKRLSKATSQPHVTVTLQPNEWAMNYCDILIENSGNAVAYDIEANFEPRIEVSEDFRRGMPAPFRTVSLLRPSQMLKSALCGFSDVKEKTFVVTVSWARQPSSNSRETIRYTLAMSDFSGVSRLGEVSPLVQIAKSVEKLRDDWKSIASGQRKIKTDVFSSDDRTRDRDELHRQWQEIEEGREELGHAATGDQPGSKPIE